MIFVVPSALMLLAILSIWPFTVALRPSPLAHWLDTFQLTRAIVAGRRASVRMSLLSTTLPVPR